MIHVQKPHSSQGTVKAVYLSSLVPQHRRKDLWLRTSISSSPQLLPDTKLTSIRPPYKRRLGAGLLMILPVH